jgi:uncharacterized membrane protein
VFDKLFELLFTYRPVVFEQGDFRFDPTPGSYAAAALGVVLAVAAATTYRNVRARGRTRDRVVLTALRVAALSLLLFCLFRPVLVVKAAVSQQNFVAVLLDDSRSMQISDFANGARSEFVRQQFSSADGPLLQALADRFVVRVFRFSSTPARVNSTSEMTFGGAQTKLAAALDGARQELAGLPVAGMVLVSDGADTSDTSLTEALLALKAQTLPVFTVGVGRETLPRDIQVDRVTTPRKVLQGTSLLIDVTITQAGYAGSEVTLDVEDEGRIVGSQKVSLPADGSPAAVRVRAMASEPGPRLFRFRVAPLPGELVTQNNVREAVIDVHDRREKILYFEGEPRFELKFIRRAVDEDKNLQIVTLQRTADNKYLRLDVDNPDELVAGFPKTREELFAYRGLILGSIEAGAFTGDQLRMIADFVDRRGGGLLMLGGPRAFGAGGYAGTPVAEALPVVLERAATGANGPDPLARLKVAPTRAGAAHAVTQIGSDEAASAAQWSALPQVTSVNTITAIKPGASVLLNGLDEARRNRVVLASQRYGRGKAIAFSVQDSWLWQMHASVAVEDQTHENYWRQLLRWLVDGVPDAVEVTSSERVEPGEPVTLTAEVVDSTFVELNDARVTAHVVHPGGATSEVPLQWTGQREGEYRGTFVATENGHYEVAVDAARAGRTLGKNIAHVRAAPSDAEYFDATMHAARLRRIAEETGGRFYSADAAAGLPEDLRYAGRGVTSTEERELWHMPIVLLALLGLVCGEWGYRRVNGLA